MGQHPQMGILPHVGSSTHRERLVRISLRIHPTGGRISRHSLTRLSGEWIVLHGVVSPERRAVGVERV